MRGHALTGLVMCFTFGFVGLVDHAHAQQAPAQPEAAAPAPATDDAAEPSESAPPAPADDGNAAAADATAPGQDQPAAAPADAAPADAPAEGGDDFTDEFDDFSDVELDGDDADLLAGDTADESGPSSFERQIVGYVAAGIAVVALAVGIGLGTYALIQYQCLQDVVACNEGAEDPITGNEFFDAKANVEHLALGADMAYLFAAAAALASATSLIRAFFFTDDDDDDDAAPAADAPAPAADETNGGEISRALPGGPTFAAMWGGAE